MPHRIFRAVPLLAAITALVLAACGGSSYSAPATTAPAASPAAQAPFPAQLPRSDGKALTLPQAPARLVSLSPGATEIIYVLGAEGELAAVDQQSDYPDAAKNFPAKLDAYQPNVEAIAALNPDLVFVTGNTDGLVDALDRLNIPVLFSDLNDVKTVDDVFAQITLLGKATGTSEKANALVVSLREREKKVTDAVQDVTPAQSPAVYHEVDSTFFSASDATFIGNLYTLLHAKNIAGDGGGSPYPQLTEEAIIAANPQVIVLADEAFGTTVESVKQRAGWQTIDAVKDNAIFPIDPDIASRAGPRIIDALEQLAKDIYPQRFP